MMDCPAVIVPGKQLAAVHDFGAPEERRRVRGQGNEPGLGA